MDSPYLLIVPFPPPPAQQPKITDNRFAYSRINKRHLQLKIFFKFVIAIIIHLLYFVLFSKNFPATIFDLLQLPMSMFQPHFAVPPIDSIPLPRSGHLFQTALQTMRFFIYNQTVLFSTHLFQ